MRRALLLTAGLGVAAVLLAALLHRSDQSFSVGLPPAKAAAAVEPGATVCREDIDAPPEFRNARVYASGPASLIVTRESARRVCVRNAGSARAILLGAAPDTPPDLLGEREARFAVTFSAGERRSALAQLPDMLQRAALFTGAWVSPPLLWMLLAAVALGLPALLAAAAYSSERSSSRSATSPSERAS
jgi:hypothetical protein